MRYWVDYNIKTKEWGVYRARLKNAGEDMKCLARFSIKVFDGIIGGALTILGIDKGGK